MNVGQRIVATLGAQYAGRAIGIVLALVTLKLQTTYLGTHDFGTLALIVTVGEVARVTADLGVPTVLARELAVTPHERDRLGGALVTYRLLTSSAMIAVVGLLGALLLDSADWPALGVYLVGVLAMSLTDLSVPFFQVNLRTDLQARVDVLGRTLALAATGVVVWADLGLLALVAGLAVSQILITGAAHFLARRFWQPNVRRDAAVVRRLAVPGLAIGAASMIGLLHYRGDTVLLAAFKPEHDVGVYNVAFRIVDQATMLAAIFVGIVFPLLAQARDDPERLARMLTRALQALVLAALAVAIGVLTTAEQLITAISSDDFADAATPASLLAVTMLVYFPSALYYNTLIAGGRQRDVLWVAVGALALNVALNVALIPAYTYNGAAVATMASQAAALAVLGWLTPRRLRVRHDVGAIGRLALLGGTCAGVVALTWTLPAGIALLLSEAVLVAGAFGLRVVRMDDIRALIGRTSPARAA